MKRAGHKVRSFSYVSFLMMNFTITSLESVGQTWYN